MKTYREFYIQHKDQLFGYLMRMTGDYYLAGDIMQESFTRHMERYGNKEPRKTLLYTIARNAFFDHHRKSKRSVQIDDNPGVQSSDGEHTVLVRSEYREVLAAMKELEPGEREILALVVSSGLSYRKIASVMGISEANVKVKVHRARVALRKILAQGGK
ncbi:MAG: RNA polymerase sigma factor [Deltaproteobacteria bacterium]|nr:RNA polymerase sigma factor [Deltaproteobacteria bacterium]